MKQSPLYNYLSKTCEEFPFMKIADQSDYPELQDLIEAEGMKVNGIGEIFYSRKPDIEASFSECNHSPVIITDTSRSIFCAASEISILENGVLKTVYYTSDLRMKKNIDRKVKAKFRLFYQSFLEKLDRECFTAILKSNKDAIHSLCSKRSNLNYNEYFDYSSETIIINPLVKLIKNQEQYKLVSKEELPKNQINEFLQEYKKDSIFTHSISEDEQGFVLLSKNKILGFISLKKPEHRRIFLCPRNSFIKRMFYFSKLFLGVDYTKKIPWVYTTQLIISSDYQKDKIIKVILKQLYNKGILKSGDVFLFCHNSKDLKENISKCLPQITIDATMYHISKVQIPKANAPVILSALTL